MWTLPEHHHTLRCFRRGAKISRRSDKRRELRRKLNAPAWIDVGGASMQQCTVVDISSGGARLELADVRTIPDTFSLLLSKFGQPRYQCSVVWKAAAEVGVEFIKAAPATADQSEHADAPQLVQSGLHAHAGLGGPSADPTTIFDRKNLQQAPGRIEPALAYTAADGFSVMGLLRRLSETLGRHIFID